MPPVNFSLSYTCSGLSSQITANTFTGGAGTYQISTQLYTSESGAYGGVFIDITTAKIYPSGTNQTYWVALRDKVNTTNVLAKSITPNCTTTTTTTTTTTAAPTTSTTTAAPTTTTTTLPPVTYDITATCTDTTQTITINNFAGGDGANYYANTTTYGDAVSAAAGATTLVTGGTRSFTGQVSGTRYVYVYSGTRSLVKNAGNTCTTTTTTTTTSTTTTTTTCSPTPNWVNNGSVFCSACISYQPQIDTNPCSPTYNTTRNLNLGAGAPCDYSANWVNRDINTYYVCSGVNQYYEQIDINPCSPTYNTTQTGALYQSNSFVCGFTSNEFTLGYGSSQADACGFVNSGSFWSTSSYITSGVLLYDDSHCLSLSASQYYSDGTGTVWYGNPLGSAADCP